ncbi:hypothetical protein LCGC14_2279640 [marine sediment metagenome]|uniref:Uncharacterized protein n=1 Tax=marine sediment metagenome TaxID=412755 RepID=A0A0F9CUW1_9ZZZZ
MRDPNRIKPLLKEIEAYWRNHPDLRLAQIISNANSTYRSRQNLPLDNDAFYLEDDDLLAVLWDENL